MRRWFYIAILTILTGILCYYSARCHPWTDLKSCLNDPEAFDLRVVEQFDEPVIGKLLPDGFMLHHRQGPPVRVYADTTGLVQGEYIGMKAVFHREGYLEALSLRVARNRRYKIGLSMIPVIIIGILFIRVFRWDTHSVHWEERADA